MLESPADWLKYGGLVLRHMVDQPLSTLTPRAESCVVLGNGPSLKAELEGRIDEIASRPKVCVNAFARSEYFERLRPEYYVLADTAFFSKETRRVLSDIEANRTAGYSETTLTTFRNLRKVLDSTFTNLIEKTRWDLLLFLPLQHALGGDLGWLAKSNPHIKLVVYNMTPLSVGPAWIRHLLYSANVGMPRAETVLISAIFLMVQLRYPTVYVIGADHSWHEELIVDEHNVLSVRDRHFDDKKGQAPVVPIIKDHVTGATWKVHEQFESLARAFQSHCELDAYARRVGTRIYNSSSKSYVDAYERAPVGSKG